MAYLSCFRPPLRQASDNGPLDSRLVTFDSRPQPQSFLSKTVVQSINRPLSLDVQNIGTNIIRRLPQFKRVTGQPTLGPEVPLSSVTGCAETPPRVHISPFLDHPHFHTRLRTPYPWGDDGCPYQCFLKGESISYQRLHMLGEHTASSQINPFYHPFPPLSQHSECAGFEPYVEWLTDHLCNIVSNSAFTQPEYL